MTADLLLCVVNAGTSKASGISRRGVRNHRTHVCVWWHSLMESALGSKRPSTGKRGGCWSVHPSNQAEPTALIFHLNKDSECAAAIALCKK